MKFDELNNISGIKIINENDKDRYPFVAKDRQRVSKEQFHALPDQEIKGDKVFGREILERVASMNEAKALFGGELPAQFQDSFKQSIANKVSTSKKELLVMIAKSKTPEGIGYLVGVNSFFACAFKNGEIKKQFLQAYRKSEAQTRRLYRAITNTSPPALKINSPSDMVKAFAQFANKLPDDLYIKMLFEYQKQFSEKSNGLREKLFVYYDTGLRQAIENFALRYGLDHKDLMTRMDELRARLEISFDDAQILGFARSLGYTESKGQITLNPFWDLEQVVKPAFGHETIHNIGGSGYRVRQGLPEQAQSIFPIADIAEDLDLEDNWDLSISAVVPEKSGFTIYNRFGWLDEAITDSISYELLPLNQDVGGYPDEISLVHHLMVGGKKAIKLDTFYKAYFEEYNPSLPDDLQFKDTKKLFREISHSFSPGFLMQLDSVIQSWGGLSPYVITTINENFADIATIIMNNEPIKKLIPKINQIIQNAKPKITF